LAFLLVFDNADDLVAVKTAWPTATRGSILVTTRDLAIATSLVTTYASVGTLGDEDGSRLLLKAVDLDDNSVTDQQQTAAIAIAKTFDGLPLALTQIGGFIKQRRLALSEFLPLYERHSSKINARRAHGSDYEHTLSSVWNVSFERLTENSTHLLNLLSLLHPDGVFEDILLEGSENVDEEFAFLSDEME
jgi:hypothetical protein